MAWAELQAIKQEAKRDSDAQRRQPPSACPIDGEPLVAGKGGIRRCPWGNYEYRG